MSIGALAASLVLGLLTLAFGPSAHATAPANLMVEVSGSTITANWSAVADATSYEVTAHSAAIGGAVGAICTTATTTCTFTPFSNAASSFYEVVAITADSRSLPSTRLGLCNGRSDLCTRPFNEVVFAGTHNSMASDDAWGIGAAAVTTQKYTIAQQLQRGIRALSLDVWYGRDVFVDVWNADGPTRSGVEPYLCHSYCTLGATRLHQGFADVAAFMQANPREVVVVYLEDYISVADTQAVVNASGLSDYVFNWSGEALPYTTSMGALVSGNKRVVLVSQNVSTANQTQWYPRLTSIGMDTDYDFNATNKLTDPSLLPASCDPTPWGRRGNGRFFVMQHFITNVIASRSASAVVNASSVLQQRALACKTRRGVMPSVLLVDYFEEPAGANGVLHATSALNDLYVAAEPRVSGISPATGTSGATVTITGTNLNGTTSVSFGATAATSFTAVSSTSITAIAPPGTGAVNVTVTTPSGSTMLWNGFTYGSSPSDSNPSVSAAVPATGTTAGGDTITITGTALSATTTVTFGGSPASSVSVIDDGTIRAVTPRGLAGRVNVAVVTNGGAANLADSFTYVEPVTPSPATPQANANVETLPVLVAIPEAQPTPVASPSPSVSPTPQSVAAMSLQMITGLSPEQVAGFDASIVQAMSAAQIRALRPAALRQLQPAAVAAITPTQARRLSPQQVKVLSSEQVTALSRSALRGLRPAAIAEVSAKTLAALPKRVLSALSVKQVRVLDPTVIAQLSPQRRQIIAGRA
jgi:hypothetical protein